MFVYAPRNSEQVADSIAEAGGKPYIINVDTGLELDFLP